MSMLGQPQPGPMPQQGVPIAPVPCNWSLAKGQMGNQAVVLVSVATPLGQFTFVLPAENAGELGKKLIEASSGVTIAGAGQMPGPPPGSPFRQ